ncbi:MAG: hypothetical protein ACTSRU_12700 [Candidatus Hodarchaeales archaeon]
MRELTTKEAKVLPFYNTTVKHYKSKGQIESILYKHKVSTKGWLEVNGEETLVFEVEYPIRNVMKKVAFRFTVPMLYKMKTVRKRGEAPKKVKEVLLDQSMRMFYWYLKAKFDAIEYGLFSYEEELASHIILDDKHTLGSAITDFVLHDKLQQLALPEPETKDPKHVEAKFTVVE